ncbi:MAG: hypothetical protein Kow0029_15110 [Candidatus Rifleibacteriota bacterium]
MKFMPLFFKMQGKNVLIVGAGKVAARKAMEFLKYEARITVIAPEIDNRLAETVGIRLLQREATENDVSDKFSFVLIATDCKDTNEKIQTKCNELRIPCSRADDFTKSDFFSAMNLEKSSISVSVFCGGTPEISKLLQKRIEEAITPELVELGDMFAKLRPEIKKAIPDDIRRKELIASFANESTLARIRSEGINNIREELIKCLS